MSHIFRSHLPYCQAHILAGALSSGGISAAVAGDMAAHIYGEILALDCVVMVPEDQVEEAEAYLCSDFAGEPPDSNILVESCPPNGDLPGIGIILYGTLRIAPVAAFIPALLVGIQTFATHPTSPLSILAAMVLMYFSSLLFLIWCLLFYSVGAGLLLHILRRYLSGSTVFRVLGSIWLWAFVLFIAAALLSSPIH
jgi:hypothetical protein